MMAESNSEVNGTKATDSFTPIAQLSPNLATPTSIKAVVTLIWPYSSATNSTAVLLAEPNFRLRREGGQVRVHFSGSCRKTVADHGIGSGDVISLSLLGAEWIETESALQTPGRSIKWELKYSERLLMEILPEGNQNATIIDIDHPTLASETPDQPALEPLFEASSAVELTTLLPKSRKVSELEAENPGEWQSPAFIKRARTSYGSLFGSHDIFAVDGAVRDKGKKRTSFGWRYTSRSPSPTPSDAGDQKLADEIAESENPQAPATTDEGCQTIGNEEALESGGEGLDAPTSTFDGPSIVTDGTPAHNEPAALGQSAGWTAMNIPSHDQETDLQAEDRSVQEALDSTIKESYTQSRDEEDVYTHDEVQDLEDRDELPGARGGFGDPVEDHSMGEHEFSEQVENWKSPMAAEEELLGPGSQDRLSEYPSPTQDGMQDLQQYSQNNPYYEVEDEPEFRQNTADVVDEHPVAPSDTDHIAPRKLSISSQNSRHSLERQTPIPQPMQSFGSRSQSASREVHDLSESNDEEGDDADDADDEDGLGFDESDDQVYDGSIAEDGEDDEVDDDGNLIPSWQRNFHGDVSEGQIYDEEDEYESEEGVPDSEYSYEEGEDYDDEPRSPNENGQMSVNAASQKEVAYIDLISDDEEEDANAAAPKLAPPDMKPLDVLMANDPGESGEDGSEDLHEEGPEDDREGNDQFLQHDDGSQLSRPSSRGDALMSEGNMSQPRLPGRQSQERSSVEPRAPRFASFDGASDEFDRFTDPYKVGLSSTVGIEEKAGEKATQVEEERQNIRSPVPESSSLTGAESTTNLVDVAAPKGASLVVESIKAQILDILGTKETASELQTLEPVSPNCEKEKGAQLEDVPAGDVADEMKGTVEHEAIVTESSTSRELPNALNDTEMMEEDAAEDTVDMIEITAEQEASVTKAPLADPSNDAEMADNSLYPHLSFEENEAEESVSKSAVEASENVQLPTPDDTQMTGAASTTSFEATQSSLVETQVTEFTSTTISFQAGDEAMTSSAAEDPGSEKIVSSISSIETSQTQEVVQNTALNDLDELAQEHETSSSKAKKVDLVIDPHLSPEPQSLPVTPRRSQRQASKALNSPKPATPLQKTSPARTESLSPGGYDASAELALASYHSPTKADLETSSQTSLTTTVPTTLKMSLRTDRGEYTVLKQLRVKQNRKPDILAIATTKNSHVHQAKKPPRDWYTDFNITDASVTPSVVTRVAIFRPHLAALPIVDVGDVVLLRNFKVQPMQGTKFSLRSEGDSSWAIFKSDGSTDIRGPPVEFGEEEKEHVEKLREWFGGLSAGQREVLERAHGGKEGGKVKVGGGGK